TNATLLYGHIETPDERWKHLELIRDLQDESLQRTSSPAAPGRGSMGPPPETAGDDDRAAFMSFIPLAFQPGTTGLAYRPPTVQDDLKLLAISRLFLD